MNPDDTCDLCGNTEGNQHHTVREMLFGTRDEFHYFQCGNCKCWRLLDIPEDLSAYYPNDYYAFSNRTMGTGQQLKHLLRLPFLWFYMTVPSNTIKQLIQTLLGIPEDIHVLTQLGITPHARILDVGCGSGKLLIKLHRRGFTDLVGIDKFIDDDIHYTHGLRIIKGETDQIEDTYDVVLSNHSFEHLLNPREGMADLRRLMRDDGAIVLRTPNADSYACRTYNGHWFALDPPRHIHVHTPESIRILAEEQGLRIEKITYDALTRQLLCSEQYQNDIPFNDSRNYLKSMEDSLFTDEKIIETRKKTKALNKQGQGDSMCVVLRKS